MVQYFLLVNTQIFYHIRNPASVNHLYLNLLSLSNLFEIEPSSEITKDVDDAVLRVIQTKMADSLLPNKSVIFNTGGSRVINLEKIQLLTTSNTKTGE